MKEGEREERNKERGKDGGREETGKERRER